MLAILVNTLFCRRGGGVLRLVPRVFVVPTGIAMYDMVRIIFYAHARADFLPAFLLEKMCLFDVPFVVGAVFVSAVQFRNWALACASKRLLDYALVLLRLRSLCCSHLSPPAHTICFWRSRKSGRWRRTVKARWRKTIASKAQVRRRRRRRKRKRKRRRRDFTYARSNIYILYVSRKWCSGDEQSVVLGPFLTRVFCVCVFDPSFFFSRCCFPAVYVG